MKTTKRPWTVLNAAMTVDGKIDTAARKGAKISSDGDWIRVDRLRADVDAVMVGSGTLIGEDPRLTVKSADLRQERSTSGRPENPAKVYAGSYSGGLVWNDDYASCTDWPVVEWKFRVYGGTTWANFTNKYFMQDTAWFMIDEALAETGPYELQADVTDCAGNAISSDIYWITIVTDIPSD